MKKECYVCDACGEEVLGKHILHYDYKEEQADLCPNCIDDLIAYALSKVTLRAFCKTCKGKGKVRGQRIDSPSCGENRPEYKLIDCPACQFWRTNT